MKKQKLIFRTPWNSLARVSSKLYLDKNENTDPLLKKLYLNILKKITYLDICAYPDLTETYKKISSFLKLDQKQIYLTSGSDLAIRSVFESLIISGDKVLITNPTYAMYQIYCKIFHVKKIVVNYKFSQTSPFLNISELISSIKFNKPRLICLPNPDSPTGQVINKDDMETILKEAKKYNSLVLIDEAYYLFYPHSYINYIKKFNNLIIVRSASKAMAIAGLRFGIVISNPKLISKIFMYKPMYEVSSISSFFIKEILKPKNYKLIQKSVNRLLEGKKLFIKYLNKKNIKYLLSHGNFIHINFSGFKSLFFKKLKKFIYFREKESHPCLKGFSRISLTTSNNFRSIINIIDEFYK
jgi:histidinol-phosphate aminotransferase